MKSNKAFTLIELLAIIVILGVITIVAVPTITTSNKKMKQKDIDEFKRTVENAAEIYVETHQDIEEIENLKNGTSACYEVEVGDLIATGLLNSNIVNPETNSTIDSNVKIKASKSGGAIAYSYNNSCP